MFSENKFSEAEHGKFRYCNVVLLDNGGYDILE